MDRILLLCLGSTILTYSISHLYRIAAIALHIVAEPNDRSAHTQVTPTGAGVIFILVCSFALWLVWRSEILNATELAFIEVLPALLLVAVIGFIDDFRPIPWLIRAPVHFIAAAWVVYLIGFPPLNFFGELFIPGNLMLVFGVIALVWLTNLYNFMDGIDGIAIGEAVFVLGSGMLLSMLIDSASFNKPAAVLLACCFGFMLINWPAAKVFMGDVGSGFLGLALGAIVLLELLLPVWPMLILLGWFVTDACLTISIRLARGDQIHQAHALHAYQHLNRALGTSKTLLAVLAVNTLWLLPLAAVATLQPDIGFVLLLLAYSPLIAAQFYCGAGQPTPGKALIRWNKTLFKAL